MKIEYDDKGKFFTDVITKTPVSVTIQTVTQRIHGTVHVHPEERLKDELDKAEQFLAVTDAAIYDQEGKVLHECQFLAVNCGQIVWVMPDERAEGER
jgi:hypothetical protein